MHLYRYHMTKRGGLPPPRFIFTRRAPSTRHGRGVSATATTAPCPPPSTTIHNVNGEGFNPLPLVFVHFNANGEGSTPPLLFSMCFGMNREGLTPLFPTTHLVLPKFGSELMQRTGTGRTEPTVLFCSVLGSGKSRHGPNRGSDRTEQMNRGASVDAFHRPPITANYQ